MGGVLRCPAQEGVGMDGMFVVTREMSPDDRALAEHLVAEFIQMCTEDEDRDNDLASMGLGAAIALRCFASPHACVQALGEQKPGQIVAEGLVEAKDIMDAHEVAHRIGALLKGGELEAPDEWVGQTEDFSRADAMRALEAKLMERRLKG